MAGISAYGAYIPLYRLARAEMGKFWGIPALPGERAVANRDEDSITMAVEAGLVALTDSDPTGVDALLFATTTAPYLEKQCATIVAAALDLRRDIYAADFTGSTRAATVALRAAVDAVESGSAKNVLVVAADTRPGEPETNWEQLLGDGAAAVLVSAEAPSVIRSFYSLLSDIVGPWRRPEDRFVRSFEGKLETEYGYIRSTVAVAKAVLEHDGVSPRELAKAVFYAPDPRSVSDVARALGLEQGQLQDTLFNSVGNTGAAHVLLVLAAALDEAKVGDKLLVGNYGDGADAFILDVEKDLSRPPSRRNVTTYLNSKRSLPNYGSYASFRNLAGREEPSTRSSPVTYWRDAPMELRLHGARCQACGTVQYPIPRVCQECGTKDQLEEVKLARKGTIYTFTLDHLYAGDYLNTPIPRAVVELEGGSRLFLEVTDCNPKEVTWGMPLELTFRRLHEGADFHNYYWRGRPIRA